MAANDSPTGIANLAMLAVGEDPILSLNPPDNTKRAITAEILYDNIRRQILRSAPWRCAKRPAQLAASTTKPPFGPGMAYPLPADYLRLYEMPEEGLGYWGERYQVVNLIGVGPCIVTNWGAPLNIWYIFDLQDCTQMDADLVMCIAKGLAAALAIPLAIDLQLKNSAEQEREGLLATARTISAQEASARELDVDVLLRSRF